LPVRSVSVHPVAQDEVRSARVYDLRRAELGRRAGECIDSLLSQRCGCRSGKAVIWESIESLRLEDVSAGWRYHLDSEGDIGGARVAWRLCTEGDM